jgi:broad specificity phosphatase PhoE
MMRLYFVRHGQSEANVQRVISNRDLPHPLTELGRQQAEVLAQSWVDVPLAAFYASPILRAKQTAQIVASIRGVPFEMADALREPDCGILEGCSDEAAWAEHNRVKLDWLLHQKFDSCLEGGETFDDLRARFVPFVEQLVVAHGGTDHNILLITHGSLLYLMLPQILTNVDYVSLRELPMPNTGIIIVEKRGDRLICLEWCGVKLAD